MRYYALLALVSLGLGLLAPALHAADPYPGGEVTLPYPEFEKIFQELKEKEWDEKHPPKEAVLSSAHYQVKIQEKSTEVEATLEVSVFKERDWVALPVLPASLAIREARLDGQPARLYTEGNRHYLASEQKGTHTLNLSFALKSGHRLGSHLSLPVLPTPTTQITVELPLYAGGEITVSPAQSVQTSQVGDQSVTEALVPATEQIDIAWQEARTIDRGLPPKLYAGVGTLLSIGEGVLRQESLIEYSILQAPVNSLELTVPAHFNVLSLRGANLKDWKVKTDEAGGVQTVMVQLNEAVQGNYALSLSGELVLSGPTAKAKIPEVALLGVERETGFIGIAATTNVEIIPEALSGSINRIDVQEVPQKVWNLSANPLLIGYKYLKHPYTVTLDVKKHEDVPSLVAAADDAQGVTVCAKSGDCVSRVTYQIRNNLKQFLKIQLPKGANYWSAFVSEHAVKAGWNEAGELLIPLEKSEGDYAEAASFPLELVYYQKKSRFWPMGLRHDRLPLPDVPLSRLDWAFYFPKGAHFAQFGGSLESKRAGWRFLPWPQGLMFGGLIRGLATDEYEAVPPPEEPAAVTSMDLAKGEYPGRDHKMLLPPAPQGIVEQRLEPNIFLGELQQAMTAGVLPVRIDLPQEGHVYHFTQLFIENEAPVLCAFYINSWLWLLFSLGLFVAFFRLESHGVRLWRAKEWQQRPLKAKLGLYLLVAALIVLAYYLYLPSITIWAGAIIAALWSYRDLVQRGWRKFKESSRGYFGFNGLATTLRSLLLISFLALLGPGLFAGGLFNEVIWIILIFLGGCFVVVALGEKILGKKVNTS